MKMSSVDFLKMPWMRFALLAALFAGGLQIAVSTVERLLREQVQAVTETANVAFTRLFVNEAWKEVGAMLEMNTVAHPRENRSLNDLDLRVRQFAKGTDLVKVKIYNMRGITVYSSDPAQLGEDRSKNPGFIAASRDRVLSETNYKGKFGAFDGEVYDRNLVSSYVPVRGPNGVEAVVELYADRTASIKGVEKAMRAVWRDFSLFLVTGLVVFWVLSHPDFLARLGKKSEAQDWAGGQTTPAEQAELTSASDLLRETTERLAHERPRLMALSGLRMKDNPADPDMVSTEGVIGSLLELTDELILIQRPDDAVKWPSVKRPFGAELETVLEVLQGRYRSQEILIDPHVAPNLAARESNASSAVVQLIKLLLVDAVRRTGAGTVRLNVQSGQVDLVHIEVIGTRSPLHIAAPEETSAGSLALKAAQALAVTLGGNLHQVSANAQGPWTSVTLPWTS